MVFHSNVITIANVRKHVCVKKMESFYSLFVNLVFKKKNRFKLYVNLTVQLKTMVLVFVVLTSNLGGMYAPTRAVFGQRYIYQYLYICTLKNC